MITEWFLGWVAEVWAWLGGQLPDFTLPAFFTDPGGVLETVLNTATGMGVWVEWSFVIPVLLLPTAVWIGGMLWKIARTAWSHMPFVGGSG